jgi:hypothetical protein
VVHHEANSEELRQTAREMVSASKESSDSPKFYAYKPVKGTEHDDKLTYLWVSHDDGGDANHPAFENKHGDNASSMIQSARGAIKGIGHAKLTRTRSGGEGGNPPKHVLAVAFKYDPSQHDALVDAAKAFDEADNALGHPLRYGVYDTGTPGERLVLIGADSVEHHHRIPRIRHHHGDDRSKEIGETLSKIVGFAWAQPLRYVPELSNP